MGCANPLQRGGRGPKVGIMQVDVQPGHQVGRGVVRVDADAKLRGRARYTDDIPVLGCWHAALVRSPVACGRLRQLAFDPAFDWSQVCVVTPADIPGENVVEMMGHDMPFLAHDMIQYRGEPLALVAAPTKALAREAVSRVRVEVEEHPSLQTLDELIARHKADPASLHEQAAQTIVKGDAEAALASADLVVEGEYTAGHQEQLYIEPQGMIAFPEADGGVHLLGSLQCPYYVAPELVPTLKLPLEKIRVEQAVVGGAFGGKEEFPTLMAGYCALLALKCGHPVKLVYGRNEDMLYTTKRHPVWVRHRTGLRRDGTIAAMRVEFVLDGGAYTTLSPVVLYRGVLHASLGYRCENVMVDGHVFRTNTFPNGAFRGFGAPQAIWALESHMDRCAEALGMAPHAFRLKNALRQGDETATGQRIAEPMGTPDVLERALERAGFEEKLSRCDRGGGAGRAWYGIGLSFFGHGSGFTGDGEARLKAKAAIDLEVFEDGRPGATVRVSSTEMGQGALTVFSQIAADALGVPLDRVRCPLADTKFAPDSGPTVASRTTMIVGHTVHNAAARLKRELASFAAACGCGADFETAARARLAEGPLRVLEQFQLPPGIRWDQKTFKGDAYPSYSWGCNIAEVEVDRLTLEVRVKRVVSCWDIGRVINPVLAKGQLEGGLVQALGYAVMEKMAVKNGLYDASRMQTYVVPTAPDVPELVVDFVEYPWTYGQPGAKGVGEIPMDGLAPAIANAVHAATGVRITELPITPEKLHAALR